MRIWGHGSPVAGWLVAYLGLGGVFVMTAALMGLAALIAFVLVR